MKRQKDSVDELLDVLILSRRQLSQLTKKALADRLGCTPGYLGAVEDGKTDPPLRFLLDYADAVGMDLSWVLKKSTERRPQ